MASSIADGPTTDPSTSHPRRLPGRLDARLAVAVTGTLAAAGYGALKLSWGLGSEVGLDGPPPWKTGEGVWGRMSSLERFLALEGTTILALLAAAILLALARPRRRALPRRLLRWSAWLGAAVMLVPGIVGMVSVAAAAVGVVDENDELALWVFGVVYGCFTVLGASFAAMAWLTRGDGPDARRDPAPRAAQKAGRRHRVVVVGAIATRDVHRSSGPTPGAGLSVGRRAWPHVRRLTWGDKSAEPPPDT